MNIIKRLRTYAAILAGPGVALAALAGTASASTGMLPPAGPDAPALPAPVVHTVVVGGTPGWQIALIAIGAALVAAIAAVLMERARSARRPVTAAA
jgi:hypothetical protein